MRRINEIFYSLQGEGYHTGIPAVFVRFSGCNLRCPFCDTQHEEGTLMSDEDIAMEVAKYSTQVVILTGGEPGLMHCIMKGSMFVLRQTALVGCLKI